MLYTILDSSAHIYHIGAKKRKCYLYQVLNDHGIWSDMSNWRELVHQTMKFKIDDAIRRKKRKLVNDVNKSSISFKRIGEVTGKTLKGML